MRHSAKGAARLEKERQAAARSRQAAAAPAGSWLDQVPYWLVVGGIAAGLLWMRSAKPDARSGTLVMAGVLLAAAITRLILPERRAGMLGSRRRLVDAAAFAALGAGLLVAGLVFPVPA
jgi:Protein of unknown function (DUF3017)